MFKALRKNMKKIMWLLVAAFVLWMISSAIVERRSGPQYAGKIRGRVITWEEFSRAHDAVRHQLTLAYGDKARDVAQSVNLEQEAWARIILLDEAKRQQIKVQDKEVIDLISRIPYFQQDGKFDNKLYGLAINYNLGITPRAFEEEMRQNIAISKLLDKVRGEVKPDEKTPLSELQAKHVNEWFNSLKEKSHLESYVKMSNDK